MSDTGLAAHADRFYVHWGKALVQGKTHVYHFARSSSDSAIQVWGCCLDAIGLVARKEMHGDSHCQS